MEKIKLDQIYPNERQPRKHIPGLPELARSIREKGLLEPIMVRPVDDHYEIIHGERRWRAAKLAGLTEIDAIIKEATAQEAYELSLIENIQRQDLTPIEEAEAFRELQGQGYTQQAIGDTIGKGQSYVAHKLGLLKIPEPITFYLQSSALTENHIRQIAKLENIYGVRIRGLPIDLNLRERVKDETDACALLALIRPEERVICLKPAEPVIEACRHFAEYVSKHNSEVKQWEVAGFWWASLAVMLEFTVADLALAIERWRERYEDCLLMWRTVYHDYQPTKKGDHELYWAVYADLRHSASLDKWKDTDELNMSERREYMALLIKAIKKGSWAMPSQIQAKGAADFQQYLTPVSLEGVQL